MFNQFIILKISTSTKPKSESESESFYINQNLVMMQLYFMTNSDLYQ